MVTSLQFRGAGYKAPTFIQAQAWPIAEEGRDLVAIASTGSGKTCGFLIPAFMHILRAGRDPIDGPIALVLAPTRELAQQTQEEVMKFGRAVNVRSACLYGGAPRGSQGQQLRRRPHIVIATPGRLTDFVNSGEVNLKQVRALPVLYMASSVWQYGSNRIGSSGSSSSVCICFC